jgi:outer membrane protein TolC
MKPALLILSVVCTAAIAAEQPISLPAVLRLAGAKNLDVKLAAERVAEAQAQHEAAWMQWFPYVTPGILFRRHEGNIQTVDGEIIDADKQSLTLGAAVTMQLEAGETYYKNLVAKKLVRVAEHAVEIQRQESIWQAVNAYFETVRAQAAVGVAGEAVKVADDYAKQVKQAVEAGIAFKGDAFRAAAQVERNRLVQQQAREQQRIAAARLAQVLRISPIVELVPDDRSPAPVTFSESKRQLSELAASALERRPEMAMNSEQLAAAITAGEGAKWAPVVPTLRADVFNGGLGGGTHDDGPRRFNDSADYSIGLTWRIGPGGLFDRSREQLANSKQRGIAIERDKLRDEITRQVVEAHTRVHSLAEQLIHARAALSAAEQALKLARERKAFAVGEVLENIQAEQDLTRARLDYLTVVTEHNRAQFLLKRTVGEGVTSRARKQ